MAVWTSSSGRIELEMTMGDAESITPPGVDAAPLVEALSDVPRIKKQLEEIDPEVLKGELREYGAWDEEMLADHEDNLGRILWIAAGDIMDDPESYEEDDDEDED
jgi:hypothetical protein